MTKKLSTWMGGWGENVQGGAPGNISYSGNVAVTGNIVVAVGTFTGFIHKSITDDITAAGNDNQGDATALTTQINRVTTVTGTTADGVKLPTAVSGLEITIINASATALEIFPNTDDDIDETGANLEDPNPVTAGATRRYIAVDSTDWYTA